MSTVDLSVLPAPQVLEDLNFEEVYQEDLSTFRLHMGDNWSAALESDPVTKLLEVGAYLVSITGESMQGAGIFDGDLAVVDRSLSLRTGILLLRC